MAFNNDNSNRQRSWPWWRMVLTGLTIIALVLSAIMSWHSLAGGTMPGCGTGSSCDQVLNSRWSMLAGLIPVSGLAMGAYLAIFIASFFIDESPDLSIRRIAWFAILILSGSIAGSAIWFTIVQKWIIGDFCPYCMATHITGFLLASLIFWQTFSKLKDHATNNSPTKNEKSQNQSLVITGRIIRPIQALFLILIGLVFAGILAASQVGFSPKAVYQESESKGILPTIDHDVAPIIGSPDAPYVVSLLFDYQCSHCQKIHFMLDEVVSHYNGKLAFLLCPTPLNAQCNPYIPMDVDEFKSSCELAKIGMAVWLADREAFPAFENWMFSFKSGDYWYPRSLEGAKIKAAELVGQQELEIALSDPWIDQYLHTSTQIFGQTLQNGQGGIPKMILNSRWIIPEPYNSNDLVMILQKSLGVPKP